MSLSPLHIALQGLFPLTPIAVAVQGLIAEIQEEKRRPKSGPTNRLKLRPIADAKVYAQHSKSLTHAGRVRAEGAEYVAPPAPVVPGQARAVGSRSTTRAGRPTPSAGAAASPICKRSVSRTHYPSVALSCGTNALHAAHYTRRTIPAAHGCARVIPVGAPHFSNSSYLDAAGQKRLSVSTVAVALIAR